MMKLQIQIKISNEKGYKMRLEKQGKGYRISQAKKGEERI